MWVRLGRVKEKQNKTQKTPKQTKNAKKPQLNKNKRTFQESSHNKFRQQIKNWKWDTREFFFLSTKAAGNSSPEMQSLVNKPLKTHLEKLENWLVFSHQAWDEKQTWELPIFIPLQLETVVFICGGNQLGRGEAERLCETRTNTLQFHFFPHRDFSADIN